MKFLSKYENFHPRRCIWKYRLRNGGHFVSASIMTQNTQSGHVICRSFCSLVLNIVTVVSIYPYHSGQLHLPLRWRHNDHDGVSNHQPHGCLLNRLFRRRSKKTSKLRVTGLCAGNSPGPVNSPHKGPVTRKMFPFDDVIMHAIRLRQQQWNNPEEYG